MRQRRIIPGVDPKLLIKDAAKLMPDASRRSFLHGAASLGALTFLIGCDITDGDSAESALRAISKSALRKVSEFNDGAQAALFNRTKLAPTYPESAITRPFPFNGYYDEDEAPVVDGDSYRLEVAGLVDNKRSWTLAELHALPEVSQITRHVCVEGWSAIGSWQGARLSDFLQRIGADTRAKYVWFKCAEGYTNTIDMPTALHPQTQMTFKFDNKILPRSYGFPMKIRMPTKLGFKNPKYVVAMEVTNTDKGGYWEDKGYNWFSGL
jgi:DMSO/TMAO reductase YedYZ molybdopterin-dependent catalytic subunit